MLPSISTSIPPTSRGTNLRDRSSHFYFYKAVSVRCWFRNSTKLDKVASQSKSETVSFNSPSKCEEGKFIGGHLPPSPHLFANKTVTFLDKSSRFFLGEE